MDFSEILKINEWWKIVSMLGIGAIFISIFTEIDFIKKSHLFGLGMGILSIGISYWIATKKKSAIKPPNAYTGGSALISWKETRHNLITKIILLFGIVLMFLFGFLIIKNLI